VIAAATLFALASSKQLLLQLQWQQLLLLQRWPALCLGRI